MEKIILLTPGDMVNWGSPQVLTKGAKDILLYGNPGETESYTFRFKLPENYKIEPFVLTSQSFLTVIDGEVFIGEGNTFDKNSMKSVATGSFCTIPDNHPIYFMNKGQATLQFHGIGPLDLKYLNEVDDPRVSFKDEN